MNYYYEAMAMADYAKEGHTQQEVAKEFRVSASTVKNRINMLATYKPEIYNEVMEKWHARETKFESKVIEL